MPEVVLKCPLARFYNRQKIAGTIKFVNLLSNRPTRDTLISNPRAIECWDLTIFCLLSSRIVPSLFLSIFIFPFSSSPLFSLFHPHSLPLSDSLSSHRHPVSSWTCSRVTFCDIKDARRILKKRRKGKLPRGYRVDSENPSRHVPKNV